VRAPEYTSDAIVRERHRRAVTRRIIAPVVVATLVVVAVMAIIAFAMSSRQISVVASFMSLLILVPMVLVCLVPYILIVLAFAGTRRLYFTLPGKLSSARSAAHRVNVIAHRLSMGVARPIISINQRVAWLEQVAGRKPRGSIVSRERR
jgi:hypothetical protein